MSVMSTWNAGYSLEECGLFNDWCCPVCGAVLSPVPISQSETKRLLGAHDAAKEGGCYKPRRRRQMRVPCPEPGCFARVREDRLPQHLGKHKAKLTPVALRAAETPQPRLGRPESKLTVASPSLSGRQAPAPVPPSVGPALSERPKPASPKITVPPPVEIAVTQPRGIPGSSREDRCEICHWIMPSGYLPHHLQWDCPGRPGIAAHLPFRLLPPGVWDVDHILEYYRNEARHWLAGRSIDNERLVRIGRLKPSRCSVGTEGYLGYILYEFSWSRAVVLECPINGNATYILWGDWHGMLRLTKSELRRNSACLRVIHTCKSFGRVIDALDGQKPGTTPAAPA